MILTQAVTGDTVDVRTVQIGGLEDLFAVDTVDVHLGRTLGGGSAATVTGSVSDADGRLIEFDLGSWLATVPTPGRWLIEYQLTFDDTTVQTWPPEPDQIWVRAQLEEA